MIWRKQSGRARTATCELLFNPGAETPCAPADRTLALLDTGAEVPEERPGVQHQNFKGRTPSNALLQAGAHREKAQKHEKRPRGLRPAADVFAAVAFSGSTEEAA